VSPPVRTHACDDALALLSLSLDGELSVLEQQRLERHLRACPPCRYRSLGIESMTTMLRSLPPEAPSVSSRPRARRRQRITRTGLPAVAAMAVASLGLITLQGSVTGEPGITATVTVPTVPILSPITSAPQPQSIGVSYAGDFLWAP
jgi:predicted anti-sigma-YlaC factor YlaD